MRAKGKASSHRPRWPSLPLRRQTSRRIARPKSGLALKIGDKEKSSATGGRTMERQLVMLQGQSTESCNNLLEMATGKLPHVDIIRTGMVPSPPQAEVLDTCMPTCMHSDPKDQKPLGGELNMALAEMNNKEIIDNGMTEKEFIDFDLVQEKPVEGNIDERKGIDLYLSPAENQRLAEEVGRLQCSSFICRLLGGRPSKGLLRDMLQAALLGKMPPILNILRMGLNYYHVILEEGHNVQEILDHKWITLKYGKAMILEWSPDFNAMEEHKKAGTPVVITVCFPDLPFQLHHLIPKLAHNIGMVCIEKPSFADKVAEIPKLKVLVRDIKELPTEIRVHTEDFGLRVVTVSYEGLPGQCFACKEMGHRAKQCPLYWKKREGKGNQGTKMPDNPMSVMGGQRILAHVGKQVIGEEGWVTPRKVARSSTHNQKGPLTSVGSSSNKFDILSQREEEPEEGEIILTTPIELLPRVETFETLVEPSESRGKRFSADLRMVKAWIRKGKDKESHADMDISEVQEMTAQIEAGNPSVVGIDFVMMKDWKMQGMEIPKVTVNIGTPKERIHVWSRAHMVLIDSDSSRPEIGCSFELEPDMEDGRGEESALKTFCNRAAMCMRYLISKNEAKGLHAHWKSSLIHGEILELGPNVPLVCIWRVQDLMLNPGQFHFQCGELPTDQKREIRMEWKNIWSMMTTYLSSKGESPLALLLKPSQ